MNKKLSLKNILFTNLLYAVIVAGCHNFSVLVSLPIVLWLPASLLVSFILIYGEKALYSTVLALALLLFMEFTGAFPQEINAQKYIALIFADILTAQAFAYLYRRKKFVIDNTENLKEYVAIVSVMSLIQSVIVFIAFNVLGISEAINPHLLFKLIFTSIAVPFYSLLPFLLSSYSKYGTEKHGHSYHIATALVVLSILPVALNFIEMNSLPLALFILIAFLIYSISSKHLLSSLFTFVFTLSIVLSSALNHNYFSAYPFPQNIINAQFFALFLALTVLVFVVILNERNSAFQTIKNSYLDIQNEVNRQTKSLLELNKKLTTEVERRSAIEKELTLSKNLLTESQEIANITSWEYDLKSGTIRWSESASRILGISTTQISAFLMEKYIDRIHPQDKKLFINAIVLASKSARDISIEIRYRVNSHYRNFLIRGKSFFENNVIERIVGVLSDITGWKETQLALSEKEIRYRALFDANIDPVVLIDGATKTIIDVNVAFEKLYEYTKEDVVGMPYMSISAQEFETHQSIDIALHKGFYRVPTRIHRKKTGEEFYIEGHFVKFLSGEKPQIFAVLRDNTSRKIFEYKLAEREHKFRLFFESNLIGMAETTVHKEWIAFNTKLCDILGYTPSELEKTTWDRITHPDDLANELALYNKILQNRTDNYVLEKRFIKKRRSNCILQHSRKSNKGQRRNYNTFCKTD